jgi:hypothetical protein
MHTSIAHCWNGHVNQIAVAEAAAKLLVQDHGVAVQLLEARKKHTDTCQPTGKMPTPTALKKTKNEYLRRGAGSKATWRNTHGNNYLKPSRTKAWMLLNRYVRKHALQQLLLLLRPSRLNTWMLLKVYGRKHALHQLLLQLRP